MLTCRSQTLKKILLSLTVLLRGSSVDLESLSRKPYRRRTEYDHNSAVEQPGPRIDLALIWMVRFLAIAKRDSPDVAAAASY